MLAARPRRTSSARETPEVLTAAWRLSSRWTEVRVPMYNTLVVCLIWRVQMYHNYREVPEPDRDPCSLCGVDDDAEAERLARDNGEKLAGLLRDREGWWFSTQGGMPNWCFGVAGAARLVITPEPDRFLMFIHDRETWVIPRIESVEAWLEENEQEYAGLTPLQEEFRQALEQQDPGGSGI